LTDPSGLGETAAFTGQPSRLARKREEEV